MNTTIAAIKEASAITFQYKLLSEALKKMQTFYSASNFCFPVEVVKMVELVRDSDLVKWLK